MSLRMVFVGEVRAKAANDEHFKFLARDEAAKNIGSHVYLTDEEIKRVRENAIIVSATVHPDTKK
jgi:hypothetical protein